MVLSAVENITERRYLLSLIWQWWQQPLVTYPEAMRWSPTKFYTGDEVKQLTTLLLSISLALCFIRCFVSLIFLSMTSLCSLSSGLSISTYCFICPNTTFSLCPSEITPSNATMSSTIIFQSPSSSSAGTYSGTCSKVKALTHIKLSIPGSQTFLKGWIGPWI